MTSEEKSTKYIQEKIQEKPEFGIIILENQFSQLIKEIKNPICLSYEEIPSFMRTCGKFIFGDIEGKKVVFLIEPLSYCYKEENKSFPILVCKNIGVNKLILINTSIGVNPNYKKGDIMFVKDHINFFPESTQMKEFLLKRKNFLYMDPYYDQKMLELAESIAMNHNIMIQKGVYVSIPYSHYNTHSEYAMIRSIGGDSIGMNHIISDVITARCIDLQVFSISIIIELSEKYESKNTEKTIPLLTLILKEFIKST
ncbi:phosphorylase family protein [Blattabacterium cuenoti]|uniref:phosphorylase family protein n=1 Tax=Blattabacterium cuenoti TaxID=1653831 RepID=UPI00163BD58B|nr:purine-nucleoside phosphorylase [Blattabacterium cuenoti]